MFLDLTTSPLLLFSNAVTDPEAGVVPEPKSERGKPRMGDASTERGAGAAAAAQEQGEEEEEQPEPPATPQPSGGGDKGAIVTAELLHEWVAARRGVRDALLQVAGLVPD